jgi:hypothetical protein
MGTYVALLGFILFGCVGGRLLKARVPSRGTTMAALQIAILLGCAGALSAPTVDESIREFATWGLLASTPMMFLVLATLFAMLNWMIGGGKEHERPGSLGARRD